MKTLPLLLVSVVALFLFAPMMVGCGEEPELGPDAGEQPVGKRLPCGAVDHDFFSGGDLATYRFAYDENGNQTFSKKWDSVGALVASVTREFEGNQVTRIDTVESPVSSLWTATLEGGRPVRVTNVDRNGGVNSYTETWVWNGEDLASRRRVYDNGETPDVVETFAALQGGYSVTVCPNGPSEPCELATYYGADFVGDLAVWTNATHRWPDLEAEVVHDTRSFDANGLLVGFESKVVVDGLPAELLTVEHHERDADGSELWVERSDFTYMPEWTGEFRARVDYTFDCPAP